MEDDEEFGDLYTDVLRPLMTPSFQSQAQLPPQSQSPPCPEEIPKVASGSATSYRGGPIYLNVTSDDEVGGERNSFGTPNSRPVPQDQTLASRTTLSSAQLHYRPDPRNFDLNEEFGLESGNSEGFVGGESDSQARVLGAADGNVKLPENERGSPGFMDAEPEVDVAVREGDEKDDYGLVKDKNLDDKTKAVDNFIVGVGESENKEMALDTTIPGLSIPRVPGGVESRANANFEDDWDSDSEDDLQILLNDRHHGPMATERMGGGGIGDEEDDEDGEPLVIVADNDDPGHPPNMTMEEQEWGGEDGGTGVDGEKKELSETGKVNGMGGAVVAAPKSGYSTHGYHHPYHSQFKYVRPGASPMPGAASIGPGGSVQVRPPVGMVPVAGRGRGDWRPPGIKGSPAMQKGFYPGYGMPVWGTGASGRGLEFTLPSHKTIFEVDIDGFEEKPWRHQGVDISDFFNFGLIEESWKDYCKQLEQLRLETTMQSKIRVYESGRTEQEYDPDLPPELAAAAGIQEIPFENSKLGKTDASQDDLRRGVVRVRPPLPTGRAIQVETGYGERLPSIDTRKPRISDLDVIIEIVCQDSLDDDTNRCDEKADQAESKREDLRDDDELEEPQEDTQHLDHSPHAYNSHKREVGRKQPFVHNNVAEGDDTSPFISEAPAEYHSDSREQTPVNPERNLDGSHDDRWAKGGAHSRSPMATNKERMTKKKSPDKKESSIESIDGKSSPLPSSPVSVGISAEAKDSMTDEIVRLETGSDKDKEELALNGKMKNDFLTDETRNHASKKQKLSSEFEPSLPQEVDEQEDSKAARSSENSKARSGSSNYRKTQDVVEDEEVQGGRAAHRDNIKRSIGRDDDSIRRKVRNDRQENERHHGALKGREDLYQHKGRDSYTGHSSRVKSETTELRRGVDNAEGAYQRRDEDIHGRRTRAEDTRKRDHRDETGSRLRSKAREIERHEKDEHHQLRKQLDNGSWRGSYDKDIGTRHRDRDDGVTIRNANLDELSNKRRKEEAHLTREHPDKEESLHAHRESSSRRNRERDDVPDQRRRDGQLKARNDDQHIARHKEDGLFHRERVDRQREREEWYRLKQMNQEVSTKKDREAARGGIRSGRAAEDKAPSQSRSKDDHRSSDKEFHPKDGGRQHELLNRRDRAENVSLPQQRGREDFYALGNLLNNEERRSRHERATTREDDAANASDNYKVHENKHTEILRKSKESEFIDGDSLSYPKKHQDEISGHAGDMVRLKGRVEHGGSENEIHMNNPTKRKPRDEASSNDELSESRKGRTKLERWTSQKERDFGINTKSPSSMKIRQIESYNSSSGASVASKLNDEASKTVEDKQQHLINEKDAGGLEMNYTDKKPLEDRHLDTVEKLKKRSERFKLPMPSDKEATAIKKLENEPLPSSQSENRVDFEIKAERPARKRRWTGN